MTQIKDLISVGLPDFRAQCEACPIRNRAVCSKCDADELEMLDRIKTYKTYDAGQTIAMRGEPLEMVASVVAGTAMLERGIEDGRTQMVGLLLPSDFIGRPGREALQYNVTAVSEVTLCCFQRRPFEKILAIAPHVQERLLEMAMDELDAARDWMLLLGRKTAREKIASLIVHIAMRSNVDDPGALTHSVSVDLPISREQIANYLGLTIETVSRQFTSLRKDGLIDLIDKREVLVKDMATLRTEAGDDESDV